MSRKDTNRGLHPAGPAAKRRLLAPLALSAAILHVTGAWALGLGDVVEQSAIGQGLRVKIRLIGAGDNLDPTCLRLAPAATHDLPWVRDARLAIERQLTGAFLVVSHTQPVYHPILMLGVAAGCEGGIRREYTLLLPANSALAVGRDQARPAAVDTAGSPAEIVAGPSLNELARQAFPSDRNARRRFIAAARKREPALFPDGASLQAPLPADADLDIEALTRIARRAPKPRPAAATQAVRTPTPTPRPAPEPNPAATARPEPATKPQAAPRPAPEPETVTLAAAPRRGGGMAVADRLVLFGGDPETHLKLSFSLSDPGRTSTTSEAQRQRLREEQRLTMALDEKIMTQMEIVARIRELEALQAQLAAESQRLDQLADKVGITAPTLVEAPAAVAEAPKTSVPKVEASSPASAEPPPPEEDADQAWPNWLLPAAAGLAAALLALLVMLRRRRDDHDDALEQAFDSDEPSQYEPAPVDAVPTEVASVADEGSRGSTGVDFPLGDGEADEASPGHDLDLDAVSDEAPSVDFAPLDWTPPAEDLSTSAAATIVTEEELGEEHESAVELADIMMSFGRIQGAAQTLADFIRHNPKQGVAPWIKLLDVYKAGDMRGEFDALTRQLNATFNVKVVAWDEFDLARLAQDTLESMPHIVERLKAIWATRDAQIYLHTLLRDNRDGTRQGFPIAVVDEILCLLSVLNELVGHFKQRPGDFADDPDLSNHGADDGEAPAGKTSADPIDMAPLDMDPLELDPK